MSNDSNINIWQKVGSSQPLQDAIKRALENGYSLPIKRLPQKTNNLFPVPQDLRAHINELTADPDEREQLRAAVQRVQEMTLGDLARALDKATLFLSQKEDNGEALSVVEKTLKDIDIITLAIFATREF